MDIIFAPIPPKVLGSIMPIYIVATGTRKDPGADNGSDRKGLE